MQHLFVREFPPSQPEWRNYLILVLVVHLCMFSWGWLGNIWILLTLSWTCWIGALLQICMKHDGECSNEHVCRSCFSLCWICCVLHSLHMVFIFLLPLNDCCYRSCTAHTKKCLYIRKIIKEILVIFLGYLRLGCMARDRGQIYEASDWFKEALQINQVKYVMCNNFFNLCTIFLLNVALWLAKSKNCDLKLGFSQKFSVTLVSSLCA